MKIAKIRDGGEVRWVEIAQDRLRPMTDADVTAVLCRSTHSVDLPVDADRALDLLGKASLEPPCREGAALFCVGLNYKDHVDEVARDMPANPAVFLRLQRSIVGHGSPLAMPSGSLEYDFEGEIAVVIGRPGRHIREEDAWNHVGGFTVFMDGSARDVQRQSLTAGKNFHASGSCGPWIVTPDELADVTSIALRTTVSGQEVQRSSTDKLIYSIPQIVRFLSTVSELHTGDVIATGTPAGVGLSRKPPLWLKPGDVVEVCVEGIGALRNDVGGDHANEGGMQ